MSELTEAQHNKFIDALQKQLEETTKECNLLQAENKILDATKKELKPLAEVEVLETGECELTDIEQAALKYFNLEYAESGDGSGDWFAYAPLPDRVENGYQGSSCECLSDVVEEYQAAIAQKCTHTGHNWAAVYQCRGCGEIVPEEQAQEMERRECGADCV